MSRKDMSGMQHRLWICVGLAVVILSASACGAFAANYTISGHIRDIFGVGVGGVIVRTSTGQSTNTQPDGSYAISLPHGWSGLIGPEATQLFQPTKYSYDNLSANISDKDYLATPQFFSYYSTSINDIMRGAVASADFDQDGNLDIAIAGLKYDYKINDYSPVTQIWRYDGSLDYASVNANLTGVQNPALAWGDYDNDGKPDLIVTGDTGSALVTKLYRNDGTSWPVVANAVFPGVKNGTVAWVDYDNDGRLDVLLAGESASGRITKLFHNNGDGSFDEVTGLTLPGVSECSAAFADYDSDGLVDFAIVGNSDSGPITKIYRNEGAGQFTDISANLTGVTSASVCWGDYDNDGKLDLAFCGERTDGTKITRICRNTGSGFTEQDLGLPGVKGALTRGDFNFDGTLDLILFGEQDTSPSLPRVCVNNGDGTFTVYPVAINEAGYKYTSLTWTDCNQDGKLDLLLCGETTSGFPGTLIYQNLTKTANTPPSPPSGLSATFEDNTLTLSWSAATDAQTPQDGLTYNIRVGTTPGAADIVSGHANYSTGKRDVLEMGNAYKNLTWQIHNLAPRSYYWSVQTIDGSFAGSAWASEATMKPDTQPPTIQISEPSVSITNTGPVSYTITYQGADSITLSANDITLNTTGTADGIVSVTGSGNTSRTVTIANITGDGSIGISVAADTASNLAGDFSTGAGPSATFTVNNVPPTIGIGSPSATITRSGPVTFTITYGACDAISLTSDDVTLNKTGTADGTVSISGSGLTGRTVSVSNITGDGTLGISIAVGTATDSAGNKAPAAGPSETFAVDNTPPAIQISAPSASTTDAGPVTYEITYTDAVSISLTTDDITLNKTGTADGTVSVSGEGLTTRTVTISDITGDGTLGISLAANTAKDELGNETLAAGPSDTFTVDNTPPAITIGEPSAEITSGGPVSFEITYQGADSISLSEEDITLNLAGTATGTVSVSGEEESVRIVTISDITGDGTIGISIAAGTAADASLNSAPAAGPGDVFIVDNTPPTAPTLSLDKDLTNGPDITATFGGATDANDVNYEIKIDDNDYEAATSPWLVVPLKLSEGVHTVYVRAVDAAGNTGPETNAEFVHDITGPHIQSLNYEPWLLSGGDPINVVATVFDDYGVASVIADGIYLTKGDNNLWTGKVPAAEGIGTHTVYVMAYDEAGNSSQYEWIYNTVRAVGLTNKALSDTIIMAAATKFVFTVWGRVMVTGDPDSFFVDDGSGLMVKVIYPNHNLSTGKYVSARGAVTVGAGSPVLNAYVLKQH
ncbi:MAG: FG-GAP-like repeat-containing protein [Armatimonadota bacterium]